MRHHTLLPISARQLLRINPRCQAKIKTSIFFLKIQMSRVRLLENRNLTSGHVCLCVGSWLLSTLPLTA